MPHEPFKKAPFSKSPTFHNSTQIQVSQTLHDKSKSSSSLNASKSTIAKTKTNKLPFSHEQSKGNSVAIAIPATTSSLTNNNKGSSVNNASKLSKPKDSL